MPDFLFVSSLVLKMGIEVRQRVPGFFIDMAGRRKTGELLDSFYGFLGLFRVVSVDFDR